MYKMNDLKEDVFKIIKKAGESVLSYYESDYEVVVKKNDTPVTQADIDSNKIIIKGLEKFENYGVLSEELTDDKIRLDKEFVWIIDPMDGTKDFIEKTGDFTIMIGLVKNGDPIFGAIYKPVDDILYYGIKGEGAFIKKGNEEPKALKVSKIDKIADFKILTSRFHLSDLEKDFADKFKIKDFVPRGSSIKVCNIAEGKAEVNFNPSNKTWEWDVCASDIILSEAGGKLTDMNGDKIIYNKDNPRNENGYIATNGLTHKQVVKEVKKINEKN
jgi:3'(2'), 5'-bisphosphate nucleotidase